MSVQIATTRTTVSRTLVGITDPLFAEGYRLGRIWYFYGEREGEIDDLYLLSNIHNMFGRSDFPWHLGFFMGMVSGSVLPEA